MEHKEEFSPGIPPSDPQEKISGLNVAIKATEYRIKTGGGSVLELESHLQSLREQLKIVEQEVERQIAYTK